MSATKILALTFAAASTLACTQSLGTTFRSSPGPPAVIPHYNVDSVTRDSASVRVYALVGTVVDSASGKPLESVQVVLRTLGGGRDFVTLTDSRGGFVLAR